MTELSRKRESDAKDYGAAGIRSLVHEIPSAFLSRVDRKGRDFGNLGATVVSYTVNPLVLPPLVYGAVLAHLNAPSGDVLRGAALGLFFFGLVPLAHVAWMWAHGYVDSLEIRDRGKRLGPFLVALASGILAFLTALVLDVDGGRVLVAMVGCHVVNTSLLSLITVRWKISVHCASVGGAASTLAFARFHLSGELLNSGSGTVILLAAAIVVVLMGWARVRTRAHTVGQTVGGTALGLVAPYGELLLVAKTIGL